MSSYEDTISQFNTLPTLIILGGILLIVALIFMPALRLLPHRMKLHPLAHLRSILRPLPVHKGTSRQRLQIVADAEPHKTPRPALPRPALPRPALRTLMAAKTPQPSKGNLAGHMLGAEVEQMMEKLQQSQAALRQSEAKYRGLVEQIPVVVYEADVDDVMTTTYISPIVEELLGYPASAWIRDPSFWYEHVHPDDRLQLKHATLNHLAKRSYLTSEYRLLAMNGRTVWVRDEGRVMRDAQTGRVYLQGAMLDITARKEAEAQLRYANEHDALTGIYNRTYFEAVLEQLQTLPMQDVAFIITDINALKTTNDAYGHAAGDALLCRLANILKAVVQTRAADGDDLDPVYLPQDGQDLLARIAGDELVIALIGSRAADADQLIADIQQQVAQEEDRPGSRQPHLSISIGYATRRPDEAVAHTLQRADHAMYQDKILSRPLHTLERLLGPRLNLLLSHGKGNSLGLLAHNLQHADTENAQQLQEIQQIEATYQQFIEQLPVTTYISLPDAQNSVLYISPQIENTLGFNPEEFLRQPDLWTQQIHPEDRESVVAICRVAYEQGKPFEIDYRMLNRQGHRVFIHDECWPIFNEHGHISYMQGVMLDITARHLAEERSKAFSELGAQLSATTDVSQAADTILQAADQLLNWDTASISLSSVEDKSLLQTLLMIDTVDLNRVDLNPVDLNRVDLNRVDTNRADTNRADSGRHQRHTIRDHETQLLPGSLLYQVLEEGKGMVLNPAEIALWDLRPFGNVSRPPKAVLLVPLRNGARIIGLLSVQSYKPNAYTAADLNTLQSLAGHCGGALERIWAEQMLRNQQATLQTISSAVSGRLNLTEILNDICYRVNQQLGTDATSIVLLSADGMRLACAGSDGFYESQIPESIPVEGTSAGRAIREQRTIHVQEFKFGLPGDEPSPAHLALRSRRYESITNMTSATPEPNVAYLGVPLMLKNRPVGVLELFRYVGFPTHSQWHSFLQSLAHQVAVAIDSAQLFQDVQRANQELAQAYGSTIEGWSRALDMRDSETEGHSQRVTEMTVQLAKVFGFNDEQIKHVRYGALLHDIGKLAIPDHILFNVGPLTQDEWAIMRHHPEYARDMLSNVDYLKPAMDIPYSHHERWDGSGYPLGLKGEDIPLVARIFAVVDVWDALRSSRRYREGLPDVTVLEYLRAAAGVHLDPRVVERFIQLLESQLAL